MSEFKHPVDLTPCAPHLIAIHFADESYTPTPGQQKMLCDEMWRRYVYHERLVEALRECMKSSAELASQIDNEFGDCRSAEQMIIDGAVSSEYDKAAALLAELLDT